MENAVEFIIKIITERFSDSATISQSFPSSKNKTPVITIHNTNRVPQYNFIYLNKKQLVETVTQWSFQIDIFGNKPVFELTNSLIELLTENKIKIDNVQPVENDPSGLHRTIITFTFKVDNLKQKIF